MRDPLTYGDSYDAGPHPYNFALGVLIVVSVAGALVFAGGLATVAHAAVAAPTFFAGVGGATKAIGMGAAMLGGLYLLGRICLRDMRRYRDV